MENKISLEGYLDNFLWGWGPNLDFSPYTSLVVTCKID
jgi:hypothetical protein